jgi:hypothetical protein
VWGGCGGTHEIECQLAVSMRVCECDATDEERVDGECEHDEEGDAYDDAADYGVVDELDTNHIHMIQMWST